MPSGNGLVLYRTIADFIEIKMSLTPAQKSLEKSEKTLEEKHTWLAALEELAIAPCEKENRPYLTGIGVTERIAILTRPACKCWNCGACAMRNARRWIARVLNHINTVEAKNGWKFCTITAHPAWHSSRASSVKNIRQGWKKLYNRMREKFGTSSYVKVWESHADGTFHLHFLMDTKMGKRWLKDNAAECGLGYIADVSSVLKNAGMVAGYIAKYMVKSEVIGQYPRGMRRIEVSRDWSKLPDLMAENVLAWHINQTREGQVALAQGYYNRGFDIRDMTGESQDG